MTPPPPPTARNCRHGLAVSLAGESIPRQEHVLRTVLEGFPISRHRRRTVSSPAENPLFIRARIVPRCTSFASPPIFAEAMIPKNAVILPELIRILRRELMRQLVAIVQWPIAQGPSRVREGISRWEVFRDRPAGRSPAYPGFLLLCLDPTLLSSAARSSVSIAQEKICNVAEKNLVFDDNNTDDFFQRKTGKTF